MLLMDDKLTTDHMIDAAMSAALGRDNARIEIWRELNDHVNAVVAALPRMAVTRAKTSPGTPVLAQIDGVTVRLVWEAGTVNTVIVHGQSRIELQIEPWRGRRVGWIREINVSSKDDAVFLLEHVTKNWRKFASGLAPAKGRSARLH